MTMNSPIRFSSDSNFSLWSSGDGRSVWRELGDEQGSSPFLKQGRAGSVGEVEAFLREGSSVISPRPTVGWDSSSSSRIYPAGDPDADTAGRVRKALIMNEKGNRNYRDGMVDVAIECYTQALRLVPSSEKASRATLLSNRAKCKLDLCKPLEALEDCNSCLELVSSHVPALLHRSAAFEMIFELESAMDDLKSVLLHSATNSSANIGLTRLKLQYECLKMERRSFLHSESSNVEVLSEIDRSSVESATVDVDWSPRGKKATPSWKEAVLRTQSEDDDVSLICSELSAKSNPGSPNSSKTSRTEKSSQSSVCRYPQDSKNSRGRSTVSSDSERSTEEGKNRSYPLRKGVQDCQYYLKTGKCNYQSRCKFNHPTRDEKLVSALNRRDCFDFVRTGKCPYKNCKYNHPDTTLIVTEDRKPENQDTKISGNVCGERVLNSSSANTGSDWWSMICGKTLGALSCTSSGTNSLAASSFGDIDRDLWTDMERVGLTYRQKSPLRDLSDLAVLPPGPRGYSQFDYESPFSNQLDWIDPTPRKYH